MRFKRKVKVEPKLGDTKVVKEFAYLPILVGDYYVWLEFVYSKWEYKEIWVGNMYGRDVKLPKWKLVEYVLSK